MRLVEITDENRAAVCALRVQPSQERFVASVARSLDEAAATPEAEPWYRAVYNGDEPVGFVMLSWNVPPGRPGVIGPYFLWRLLIDGRHQGNGYGTAVIDAVVELIRANGATELLTSHHPDEDGPGPFYGKYGFQPTGEVEDGEPVLRLRLTSRRGGRTTPPRPIDVEARFPELAAYRKDAVRLHPRRGKPGARDSSVGGPMLWPVNEPWPDCEDEHPGTPYVPVLQLFATHVPELPFPPGTDVLQVLWCPFDHDEIYVPRVRVFWRDSAGLEPAPLPPTLDADDDYRPNPCVLHPERFIDYPSWDLPGEVWNALEPRFDQLETETGWSYQSHLSVSEGLKVDGYPTWTQDPDWPDCPTCGRTMDHLLTVNSAEFDGATWVPVEDTPAAGTVMDLSYQDRSAIQSAPGLMLGDMGGIYLFECRTCPDRPYTQRFDCS